MSTRVPRTFSEWTVLTSTSLAVVAVFLDTSILFVAFPSISASFSDVSTTTMSWVLNAYTIVFAALAIPAGRLADRVGRRKTFLTAVVIFTVASVLCGLAPTVGLLILGRILQAVGAAALVPASLALVLQTFPREKVPMAVAIWGAIGAIAGAAGPTIGALVVENFGWRWAFFLNVPVGIVSFVMARRVLPEGREANPGRLPDPMGVVLLASGLALLAFAIVKTADWGWTSVEFVGCTLVATALLAVFIHRCRVVSNPLLELSLFRVRNFRWANGAAFVFAIGFNAMFLGNVLFFTMVWHFSILESGLAIGVGPLIVALTAPWFGKLAGRIGQRALLIPGGLVFATGGAMLLGRVSSTPSYATEFLPAMLFTALGVALCLPQLSSAAVQGLPADRYGLGSATTQAIRNLGGTVGVAVVIAFVSGASGGQLDDFRRVWWLMIVCGLMISLLSTQLSRGALTSTREEPAVATA